MPVLGAEGGSQTSQEDEMTRRSDMMCEDLWGCDHKPKIPISDSGEIVSWRCNCGAKEYTPEQIKELNERAALSR